MTREEAIRILASSCISGSKQTEALETLIPELRESEDERTRKQLIDAIKIGRSNSGISFTEEAASRYIAWLEKQKAKEKQDRMMPVYNDRDSFESALDKAWKSYNESGARTVDGCEDDYVECAHAKGFREGYLFGIEKRKEQKPSINIDQLKSLMLQYLQEAANEKDDLDIEADTDKWARKILGYDFEQKPVDYEAELKKCKDNPLYFYDKYVSIKQKPAEWSEEDEDNLNRVIRVLEDNDSDWKELSDWLKSLRPQPKKNDMITPNKEFFQWIYDRLVNVHKEDPNVDYMISFKKRIEELSFGKPSWKPSEEQMKALQNAVALTACDKELARLYNQLKKL